MTNSLNRVAGVTDHALVRWLEREHGIDMEGFRAQLLEQARPFLGAGASGFPLGSLWAVASDGKLITVAQDKAPAALSAKHIIRREQMAEALRRKK